jgi:hypothetical protein
VNAFAPARTLVVDEPPASFIRARAELEAAAEEFAVAKVVRSGEPLRFHDARARLAQAAYAFASEAAVLR